MNARDFFVKIPELCKAKNADRWAWIIGAVYDAELKGGTPFDKNEHDKLNPLNRNEVAFAFDCDDEVAKDQCRHLSNIIMLSHYVKEHKATEYAELLNSEVAIAKDAESDTTNSSLASVASVMTVEQAMSGGWAG